MSTCRDSLNRRCMSYTPRPTLFSAAIDLLPHLSAKPLVECSDDEIQTLAKRGIRIARAVADELSESFWSPTIAPMPTLATIDRTMPHSPDGSGARPEWIRLPKKADVPSPTYLAALFARWLVTAKRTIIGRRRRACSFENGALHVESD